MHLRTFLSYISLKQRKKTKKIFEVKQQQDITLNHILKKSLIVNLDSFLKIIEKSLKKKRWSANAFKQKSNMDKQNFKIIIINTFRNPIKKKFSIAILASVFRKYVEDIAIIGVDTYCLAC